MAEHGLLLRGPTVRSRGCGGCCARGVCVAFSLGGCGLTPPPRSRRESEREGASEREKEREKARGGGRGEKKDLLKRSNQRWRRKATGRRALPTPAGAARWGQRDPCRRRRVEAGPAGRGRGLAGRAGYPRETPELGGPRSPRPAGWSGPEGVGRVRRPRGMGKSRHCLSTAPGEEVIRMGQPLHLPPTPPHPPTKQKLLLSMAVS